MSGTSFGAVVLHVAPESAVGGLLAFVRDGDEIQLDVSERRLVLVLDRPSSRRGERAGRRPRAATGAATESCTSITCSRRTTAATSTSCAVEEESLRTPSPISDDEGSRHGLPREGWPSAIFAPRCGGLRRASDRSRSTGLGPGGSGRARGLLEGRPSDAGAAHALARDCGAIVHTAAIPQPIHNPPTRRVREQHHWHVQRVEAAIAAGVRRFVNFSSEPVPGFIFPQRPFEPDYLPMDEEHPFGPRIRTRPRSGSAELLYDGATERSDIR